MTIRITRSVKLLNYVQNDNGLTKFYSELDSGLDVGDYVYFSGGNYDNSSTAYDNSYDPFSSTAYIVKAVNNNDNSFTLNITYTGTLVMSGTDDVFCGRSVFISGQATYPKIGDALFGRLSSTDSVLGVKTIPVNLQNSNPTYLYQGIWNGGILKHGQWSKWPFSGSAPNVLSNKMVLTTTPVKTSVTANNDGYGYALFRSGEFGSGTLASSHGKWFNGKFYGGTFTNGIWTKGEMSSIYDKCTFTNGKWYAGIAKDVYWLNGTWYNGTWYGAHHIDVTNMTISGANLRCYVDSKYLGMFTTGDTILLTGITGTSQTPSGDSVFNNYTATVNNTTSPTADGYIRFTKPSTTVPNIANYTNAKISFSAFEKGVWQAGTANNGIFGNTGSTADTDLSFTGTANSIVWLNGFFAGTMNRTNTYGGSRIYNGLILNSSVSGSSMYNGHFKDGVMDSSKFDGGFFINSTAINCVIGSNSSYKAVWVFGTFLGGSAGDYTYWKTVNYMGGQWAYPLMYQAQLIPNSTYNNLGTITTLQLPLAGQQTFNISSDNMGKLMVPAVASAFRSTPDFIPINSNKPIGIIEYNGITYYRGYKYLTPTDSTNLNAANISPSWASPGPAPTIDTSWTMLTPSAGAGVTNYDFFGTSSDGMPTTWQFRIGATLGITTYYLGPGYTSLPAPGVYTLSLEIDFDEIVNAVSQLPPDALEIINVTVLLNGSPYYNVSGSYMYPGSGVSTYSFPWSGPTTIDIPDLASNAGNISANMTTPGDQIDITITYRTRNSYMGIQTTGTVLASFEVL